MAYFANSSEGAFFDEQCCNCIEDIKTETFCPISTVQQLFNYDQNNNKELEQCLAVLVDDKKGCQLKPFIDSLRNKEEDRKNEQKLF